jgi:hypothetical protein
MKLDWAMESIEKVGVVAGSAEMHAHAELVGAR